MKQPQRLMNAGSPRARQLLASLAEDVPPDPEGGPERILRALDVGPDSSGAIPVARPAPARRWVPIASLCGLVVACASIFAVSQREGSSRTREAEPVATPIASSIASSGATSTAGAGTETRVDEAPVTVDVHALAPAPSEGANVARPVRSGARRDSASAPTTGSTGAAEVSSTGDPTDELQLLERAQAAAARGQGDEALTFVARHGREFPRGRFAVEMSVVEIEELARAGRLDEAEARGERFLASHPGSPYTRRVEAVVRSRGQQEQPR
jgi:hypothetical protein